MVLLPRQGSTFRRPLGGCSPKCEDLTQEAWELWEYFSPGRAPYFGGLWEVAVQSVKTLLKKVVGSMYYSISSHTTLGLIMSC